MPPWAGLLLGASVAMLASVAAFITFHAELAIALGVMAIVAGVLGRNMAPSRWAAVWCGVVLIPAGLIVLTMGANLVYWLVNVMAR